ncbi:MAG: TonB-dependent receptor [Ignavibacteriales bacterium]|nr:TonB-dependent receptor [Ignavibacteriales bacterium]
MKIQYPCFTFIGRARAAWLIVLMATTLAAQEKAGIISGEVRDAVTKQALPGANVVVVGIQRGAATDEKGYFVIKSLPPGTYQLKVSYIGYQATAQEDISVVRARNTTVHLELAPVQIELEGATVTGGYFRKPTEHTVSYRTLSPQEIRRSPGSAEDIFRVMQSLPGVATAGGKSAQLIVRGGSPDENLTLLDNIEIYNPIHFARTGESMGIISIINPSLLREVNFLTGGFPAKYGDKMSSVFDMTMVDGNKELHNTDINANVAGLGAMVDGPVLDNGTMVFSARRGFFDLLTSLLSRPAAPSYYDAVGKLTYDLDPKNRLSFVGFYYLDQIKREGGVSMKSSTDIGRYNYLMRDDYGTAFGVNWRYLISPNAYSLTTLSYSDNGWNTLRGTEAERDLIGEDILEKSYTLKSELTYQVSPSAEIRGGAQMRYIESKQESWKPADTTRSGQIVPASSIAYLPKVVNKPSAFLQSTWKPWVQMSVTAGVRYDYFSFTREATISPRLSASYQVTSRTAFNAAYGRFYQTPASYQIALDPLNQQLRSSSATHYIFGVEHLLRDDLRGTLEVYYKDLSNVIVASDTNSILYNTGSGFARGIEFSLQKKFTDGFVGTASYTYSESRRRDAQGSAEYYFEFDRPHILNLIAGLELGDNWQLGAKFQYASGNPFTPVVAVVQKNNTYYAVDGGYNSARFPAYHKLDVRIDKKVVFGSWTLTAYLDLWNVYNRQNVLDYSYKVDARGIITETPRYDFGILPIVGLSVQF